MIDSGSHTPGIDAADFGLPAGTALRFERSAAALRPILSTYAVFDSDPALWTAARNWRLHGWTQIWIGLDAGAIDVAIGGRKPARLGSAMLFGVTSRAMPFSTSGGVTVVIDIGPRAWGRLFAASAEALRDRVIPLDDLLPPGWSDDLIAAVAGSDGGPGVKGALDAFFLERLPPLQPHEALIARITALLADAGTHDLADAAAQACIDRRTLLRTTRRHFGFAPKMLTMRRRFLSALVTLLVSPDGPDFAAIPAGYHDASHFIRDANRFVGMTPRRFLAMEMPYTRAALRARSLVMGADRPRSLGAATELQAAIGRVVGPRDLAS